MVEIVRYISGELQNPAAADRLAMKLVNAAESVLTFPYALPAYQPIRPLKCEYRKILVQNFFNVLLGGRRKEVGDSRSCSVC
jgi:toxin ParE1/3/4